MGRMFTQYKDDGQDIGFIGWSIKDICDIWDITIRAGDEKTLQAKLITDGYVKVIDPSNPEIICITNKGLGYRASGTSVNY
jgi:hypothetical protein